MPQSITELKMSALWVFQTNMRFFQIGFEKYRTYERKMMKFTILVYFKVICSKTLGCQDKFLIWSYESISNIVYYPFKKHVESESFFFSVCCPSVMSLKPLFEWSQLQLSCKFITVGIQLGWIKTKMSKMNALLSL